MERKWHSLGFDIMETDGGFHYDSHVVGYIDPEADSEIAILVRLYVHPSDRGLGFGRLLHETFEEWAHENGANKIRFIVMPESKCEVPNIVGACEKLGYYPLFDDTYDYEKIIVSNVLVEKIDNVL